MGINKKTSFGIIAAAFVALSPITSPAQSVPYRTPQWLQTNPGVRAPQATDRLIAKFKAESANVLPSGAVRAKAIATAAGAALRHVRTMGNRVEIMSLPAVVSNEEAGRMAARIAADPNVEYAEPDYKMYPALTPTDPGFEPGIPFLGGVLVKQWYLSDSLSGINAPAAWDFTQGASTTIIAVVDTGILEHSDLAGRLLQGYDFIGADGDGSFDTANDGDGRDNDTTDPGNWITAAEAGLGNFSGCPSATDSDWHGTHVAGVIAANANSDDIAGINWFAKILPVRALGKCGGYASDIIDGMRWAAGMAVNNVPPNNNPAKIINLSLGIPAESSPPACSQSLQDAINDVVARGVTVVTAAGNNRENSINALPANCAGLISVGASLKTGQFASEYSNFGPLITLSAPGGVITNAATDVGQDGILSLNDTGTTGPVNDDAVAVLLGTSFSAAIVSGVASLLLDLNGDLTPSQIKAILQSTSRRPSNPTDKGLDCLLDTARACQDYVVDAAAAVNETRFFPILAILDSNRNDVSILDFGRRATAGTSPPKQLIVRNPAGANLTIFGLSIAGKDQDDFAANTTCANPSASNPYPFDLSPGAECSIEVTFTSRGNNIRSADIVVAGDVDIPIALVGSGPVTSGGGGNSGGGGGGGGCALGAGQSIDPTLWLLLLISVAYLARRRSAIN